MAGLCMATVVLHHMKAAGAQGNECMLQVQLFCAAGRREWAPIQKWCHKHMETALKAWFGNVEVVREGSTPLDPGDRYIFGYAPHGLFPIGTQACLGCCHSGTIHAALPVLSGRLHYTVYVQNTSLSYCTY